jgi:hypothetical protein
MGGILAQCSVISGNIDVLTENRGTLDLQNRNKNRSGAAKRRTGKFRLADASAGDAADGQNQQGLLNRGLHPTAVTLTPRRLSTSGLQTQGNKVPSKHGHSNLGPRLWKAFTESWQPPEIPLVALLTPGRRRHPDLRGI